MNFSKIISRITLTISVLVFSNCSKSTVLEEEFDINQKEYSSNIFNSKKSSINNQKELAHFILENNNLKQLDQELISEVVLNTHFNENGIINFNFKALKNYSYDKEYFIGQQIIDGLNLDLDYLGLIKRGSTCGPLDACIPAERAWCNSCPGGIDYSGINLGNLIQNHWEYVVANLNKDFTFNYEEYTQLPEPQTNKWYFEHFPEAAYKLGYEEGNWINEHINNGDIKVFASKAKSGKNETYIAQLIFPKNLKRIDSLIESHGLIINDFNFLWGKWMFCNCKYQYIPWFETINCHKKSIDECFRRIDHIAEFNDPLTTQNLIEKITEYKDLDKRVLETIFNSSINEALNTPEILKFK